MDAVDPLKGITLSLNEEQIEMITDWFESNATQNEDVMVVTVEKLLQFLSLKKFHKRSFEYPSYMSIMTDLESFNAGRVLTKELLLYVLNKCVLSPDVKHELTLAFALFDTEKRGYMDLSEYETILTMYEEKLEPVEIIEFMRDSDFHGDGTVYYKDLVEMFFNLAPELWDLLKKEYLYEDPNEDPSVPPDVELELPLPAPQLEPEKPLTEEQPLPDGTPEPEQPVPPPAPETEPPKQP